MTLALNTLATLVSNVLIRAMGMATFLLTRRFLGPEMTGVWNLIQTFTGYCMSANTGVIFGAEREIPVLRGKGDRDGEDRTRRQMFSTGLVESAVMAGFVLVFVFWRGERYVPGLGRGLFWAAAYVVLWRMSECFLVSLRTLQRFVLLARLQTALSVMDFILMVGLTYFWRLNGQYAAFAVSLLIRSGVFVVVIQRQGLFSLGWHMEKRTFWPLFSTGFPLVLYGILWQVFTTADSLIVAKRLGVEALGFYSLGVSVGRALGEIPAAFSTVVSPRVMEDYGATDDLGRLGENIYRYLTTAVCFIIPLVFGAVYFFVPVLVRHGLDKFVPALPIIRVLILGGVFISLVYLPLQSFMARKKTLWFAAFTLAACPVMIAAAWLAAGRNLQSTAVTAVSVQGLFLGVVVFFTFNKAFGVLRAVKSCLFFGGALAWVFLTAMVLEAVLPSCQTFSGDLARAGSGMILSLLCVTPLFFKAEKELDLTRRLKELWVQVR